MATDPMKTGQWQRQRTAYLNHAATTHTPCGICGHPIDYQLPGTHPAGPTIDHIHERARGCDVFDESNWRPAHWTCNQRRGASLGGRRLAAKKKITASRDW